MIHVVLYEPEIPQNTGNIMRTCMAAGCALHLIEPLGFSLSEQRLRRAGLDYMRALDYDVYPDWDHFIRQHGGGSFYFLTRYGKKAPSQFSFTDTKQDIYLVFGKESTGIPLSILRAHADRCMRLPMKADARSLNVSNCVAIAVYEVLRQQGYPGLSAVEVIKGEDWIDHDD